MVLAPSERRSNAPRVGVLREQSVKLSWSTRSSPRDHRKFLQLTRIEQVSLTYACDNLTADCISKLLINPIQTLRGTSKRIRNSLFGTPYNAIRHFIFIYRKEETFLEPQSYISQNIFYYRNATYNLSLVSLMFKLSYFK